MLNKAGLPLSFDIFITLEQKTINELEADSQVNFFPSNGLVYLASKKHVGAWFSHLGTTQTTLGIQKPFS